MNLMGPEQMEKSCRELMNGSSRLELQIFNDRVEEMWRYQINRNFKCFNQSYSTPQQKGSGVMKPSVSIYADPTMEQSIPFVKCSNSLLWRD